MESSPLVSVIIPTFNMGRFLPEALESVLAQTYADLEIQVVDDGSSDDTSLVIERYLADRRVQYHRRPKRGVAAARNFGIRASRGPLIALCDADDMWSRDKLEIQVDAMLRNEKVGVVYTEIAAVDAEGEPRETQKVARMSGSITEALFVTNFVTGSSSLIRRRFLDQAGPYDESLTHAEDYDLWLRLSICCEFLYLDEVTYFYRHWDGQSTSAMEALIECALLVRQRFVTQNPQIVSRAAQRDAWSRIAVEQGLSRLRTGDSTSAAIRDMLRALRYSPFSKRAWKGIARAVLSR